MVNLTRIYTRTGDDGTTALGDMSRALKTDLRLEAFADVDEANSSIGVAIAMGNLLGQVDLYRLKYIRWSRQTMQLKKIMGKF